MELYKITREELDVILKNHELWLESDGKEGYKLELTGFDLSYKSFRKRNLSKANFSDSDCHGCDFSDSDLSGAILSGCNLRSTCMINTKMIKTNLGGSDLEEADLFRAVLDRCFIYNTNFIETDLKEAIIKDCFRPSDEIHLSTRTLYAFYDEETINLLLVHLVGAIESLPEDKKKNYLELLNNSLPFARLYKPDCTIFNELLERKRD